MHEVCEPISYISNNVPRNVGRDKETLPVLVTHNVTFLENDGTFHLAKSPLCLDIRDEYLDKDRGDSNADVVPRRLPRQISGCQTVS